MTTSINIGIKSMRPTVQCPTCGQHEMSVDYIGWGETGNSVCAICSTNWRIEHPLPPKCIQLAHDWVLTEQPQDFLVGKVLLQHRRYGFFIIVEECLQGDKEHPDVHFEELYDNGTVPLTEVLGVEHIYSPQGTMDAGCFAYVDFKSHDAIRQHFGWDWKQFAENGPLSQEEYAEVFPAFRN